MIPETETIVKHEDTAIVHAHPPSPKVHVALEQMLRLPVPIAFVAGKFPAVSETFVYSAKWLLRERGWKWYDGR